MSVSNSPLSYADAYAAMDAALADENGVRLRMPDEPAAINFRMRCHQARKIDREKNLETYTKGDPLYGTSIYDKLVLRIRPDDDCWWIYFEQNTFVPGAMESLTTGEEVQATLPVRAPQRLLPAPEPTDNASLGDAFDNVQPVDGVVMEAAEPTPKGLRRI